MGSAVGFLPSGALGKWLEERGGIWQMSLRNQRDFERFAKDRGLSFSHIHIERLWALRLLQADLVISKKRLRNRGLIFLRRDHERRYLYADERLPMRRAKGWANALEDVPTLDDGIELLFHPFRYFVLYQLERLFELRIVPIQMLRSKNYGSLLQHMIESFAKQTSHLDFTKRVARWNAIATLAVATEPFAYTRIYHQLRWSVGIDEDEQEARIAKHWEELTTIYEHLGREQLEEVRKEICITRDMLDQNGTLHTLLRLSNAETRVDLRGLVGGAMVLLAAAETIRLAEEKAFGVQLPEEDELGFGWWPHDAKKNLYGSNRILDGDKAVAAQFMRHLSLDYGIRARWYVEGDTEYYAIREALNDLGATHVELINLRGHFVEKSGKGLQFRDSLRGDINARRFSMISLDGDRIDNQRTVQKAARDDEMCGMFFISKPDFEFQNFSISELEEVLWTLLAPEARTPSARETLHTTVAGATSAKQLLQQAHVALSDLKTISKGESWGRALFEFAAENPDLESGERRPMFEAISFAVGTSSYDYPRTRNDYRTDPETGKSILRKL